MAAPAEPILVTGASGFLGRAVVRVLAARGRAVRALVRPGSEKRVPGGRWVETVRGDVRDAESLRRAAAEAGSCVHLVALLRPTAEATLEAVNDRGTARLVAACRAAGVRRFVHVSALGVGRGVGTAYFRTKEAGEAHVTESALAWTVLRPSVLHGPEGDFMVQMARMVARPGPVPLVGAGRQVLQPVFVEDVAELIARALERPATVRRTVDVGGPDVLSLRRFYRLLGRAVRGREPWFVPVPTPLVRAGAWGASKLTRTPPITPDEVTMLQAARPCDIRPMADLFELEPAALEPTLARYADALKRAAGLA